MKRIFLTLSVLISMFAYSQQLTVTTEGIFDAKNPENTYIVIEVKGRTAVQLYDSVVNYFSITEGIEPHVIEENKYAFDIGQASKSVFVFYEPIISFKEGRIKYEIYSMSYKSDIKPVFIYSFSKSHGLEYTAYKDVSKTKPIKFKSTMQKQMDLYVNNEIKKLSDYLLGITSIVPKDNW